MRRFFFCATRCGCQAKTRCVARRLNYGLSPTGNSPSQHEANARAAPEPELDGWHPPRAFAGRQRTFDAQYHQQITARATCLVGPEPT
jgi:hypothetical protein